jgi:hypothetical protein
VPETRLFEVTCKACGRTLATVERIRRRAIVFLEAHLRACTASEALEKAAPLGEIMGRVCVRLKD